MKVKCLCKSKRVTLEVTLQKKLEINQKHCTYKVPEIYIKGIKMQCLIWESLLFCKPGWYPKS